MKEKSKIVPWFNIIQLWKCPVKVINMQSQKVKQSRTKRKNFSSLLSRSYQVLELFYFPLAKQFTHLLHYMLYLKILGEMNHTISLTLDKETAISMDGLLESPQKAQECAIVYGIRFPLMGILVAGHLAIFLEQPAGQALLALSSLPLTFSWEDSKLNSWHWNCCVRVNGTEKCWHTWRRSLWLKVTHRGPVTFEISQTLFWVMLTSSVGAGGGECENLFVTSELSVTSVWASIRPATRVLRATTLRRQPPQALTSKGSVNLADANQTHDNWPDLVVLIFASFLQGRLNSS